ncbi:hypothetical protein GCM10011405_28900 [Rufibacter glacialis]|nr:hypothetical protein GCM10011405_28900 [Rufibacter glacialis]
MLPPSLPLVVKGIFLNVTIKNVILWIDDTFVDTKDGDYKSSFKISVIEVFPRQLVYIE